MKTVHLRMLSLAVPRWKRVTEGRRPKIIERGLTSPGLATQRDRILTAKQGRLLHQRHSLIEAQMPWGGHPLCGRPAGYLPPGTVGQWPPATIQWRTVQRAATRKPTRRGRLGPRAGIPMRTRPKLPPNRVLSNQRGLHQCTLKVRDPKTLERAVKLSKEMSPLPISFEGAGYSVHRQSAELPCCASET